MAAPPSSPPPPPPPTGATSQLSSTLKRTRKATRLRSLATRLVGAEGPLIPWIVARDKVDVTYENWKQVPAAQKDLIWENIQPTRKVSMTLYAKSTTLARRSEPNFVRPAETLRWRMCEKRHRPSRNKTLPLTCCLVEVMNI
ncbi:hypothetical protein GmHk_01G001313 [Glycine max]|nr:hypothetical protein GmHk_01G001313 [Glycine max]